MVQPTSPILIFDLGFRFYSRQSIISAQPVLLSLFVPRLYASSSFYSSFHLVCCIDILYLDCSGSRPPFRLGFLAASPIAGSIRGVFIFV
jgi:hypothetical protein